MGTVTQYCWLKVTEALPGGEEGSATSDAHYGLWWLGGAGLNAALLSPTWVRSGPAALAAAAAAPCPTCPDAKAFVGGNFPGNAAGPIPPAPAPRSLAGAGFAVGWQLETAIPGPAAPNRAPDCKSHYFALHPMGTDREVAVDWLSSPDGLAWVEGSLAVTLLSFVTELAE